MEANTSAMLSAFAEAQRSEARLRSHRVEEQVRIGEAIRAGRSKEALQIVEKRIQQEKGHLERALEGASTEGSPDLKKSLARVAAYQERFPWSPAPIQAPRSSSGLFEGATLLPKYEDGRMAGLRVSSVHPSGFFAQLGIRDGDVITRFNQQPVSSSSSVASLLEVLSKDSSFELTVRAANGVIRQIHFPTAKTPGDGA
jgi:type II secretory pathway component PulC